MILQAENPAELRAAMVAALREEGLITSDRVAAAMSVVPRHLFAPDEPLSKVYDTTSTLAPKLDGAGNELSVVSASHIQAVMLEQARIEPGMRVLEIGSGGYNAALMAELTGLDGAVTTIDIDADITARASEYLYAAGYDHVRVRLADAEHGLSENAPYDRIIATVGAWDIPPAWIGQLAATGRLVVPLRCAGLTRLVAFDRTEAGLVSDGYRLGAFVPMQGDGAHEDRLVPITGEVALRLDGQVPVEFDVAALRRAVHSPRIERWSGAVFDLPDELELFLATSGPAVPILHVSQDMVEQGVFAASARRGVPALVEGGSFAYRTKRANLAMDTGFETGVCAHGPDADLLADRYVHLLRRWATTYRRRHAARIAFYPHPAEASSAVDATATRWTVSKPHGVVVVSWP